MHAYLKLHAGGLSVTFTRPFSVDWSYECAPVVVGSVPTAGIDVRRGSTVSLLVRIPFCRCQPRPSGRHAAELSGPGFHRQAPDRGHRLDSASQPVLGSDDPAAPHRRRREPVRQLHDHRPAAASRRRDAARHQGPGQFPAHAAEPDRRRLTSDREVLPRQLAVALPFIGEDGPTRTEIPVPAPRP
jgi:hypothetical protein